MYIQIPCHTLSPCGITVPGTHLWVNFDGSNVRLFVNVFDAGFIYITVVHLDLKETNDQ